MVSARVRQTGRDPILSGRVCAHNRRQRRSPGTEEQGIAGCRSGAAESGREGERRPAATNVPGLRRVAVSLREFHEGRRALSARRAVVGVESDASAMSVVAPDFSFGAQVCAG
jgi:hypothetical protein